MKIIDGKAVAEQIRADIAQQVDQLNDKPGLAVVLVGDNPASKIYVSGKEKAAKAVGMTFRKVELPEEVSQDKLMQVVDELNTDPSISGFIVQLPLPKHIDEQMVIDGILPMKDADGFSPVNLGSMLIGQNVLLPATPKGIMRLLDAYKVPFSGKHAVVVGRSNIVGKPVSLLLQQRHCTVTMCHSRTQDLSQFTKNADILIVSVGQAHLISRDMVKKGAVVIDVGMNEKDGKMVGDVDFEGVSETASCTPVPGGVGPMTIAMLLENTLECYRLQHQG